MPDKPNKDTVCAAAITALSIGATGDVAPCCEFDGKIGSLHDNSLRQIWQDKPLAELRKKLANGTRVKTCWKCWQAEDAGGDSLRERLNWRHADILQQDKTESPHYLDFRFSNLCNFRCRTCHHGASSRWFADAKAMGTLSGNKAILSAFDHAADGLGQFQDIGKSITHLYFAGGEPLLEQQHYDMLKLLIEHGKTDICLAYNTNLSTLDFEGNDLIALWKQFPTLDIEVSIDAIGAAGALIRKGFDWQIFRDNLAKIKQDVPHANIRVGVTVSVLNILRIVELHRTLVETCAIDPEAFNFHAVQTPRHYDISILPKDIKEIAMVRIGAYAHYLRSKNKLSPLAPRLDLMVARMDTDASGLSAQNVKLEQKMFRKVTAQLDALRSETTLEILPELRSLIDG